MLASSDYLKNELKFCKLQMYISHTLYRKTEHVSESVQETIRISVFLEVGTRVRLVEEKY